MVTTLATVYMFTVAPFDVRCMLLDGKELVRGGYGWSGTVEGVLRAREGWRRDAGWLDLLLRL